MRSKSWVLVLIFLLAFLQVIDIQAQNIQKKVSIQWTENLTYKIDEDLSLEFLNFEDAISDFRFGDLPLFFQKIAVDNFFSACEVQVSNARFEPLSANAKEANDEFQKLYSQLLNIFTQKFITEYCLEDGSIDWKKLVIFNSGRKC